MRLRCAGVLTLGVFTLFGSTEGVAIQFNPSTARWHVRSTDHFEIYFTKAADLSAIVREAERAYSRVSRDMRREISARVPLILVPTARDLPRTEREAAVIVRASGAPDRDHLLLPVEPHSGREKMLAHELTHVFEFDRVQRAGVPGVDRQ